VHEANETNDAVRCTHKITIQPETVKQRAKDRMKTMMTMTMISMTTRIQPQVCLMIQASVYSLPVSTCRVPARQYAFLIEELPDVQSVLVFQFLS
jgi:hypothetical protein